MRSAELLVLPAVWFVMVVMVNMRDFRCREVVLRHRPTFEVVVRLCHGSWWGPSRGLRGGAVGYRVAGVGPLMPPGVASAGAVR